MDIKSKDRLPKICNVPATSSGPPRLLFLLQKLTVLMRQTKQAVCAIKQSILLRCLWFGLTYLISMDSTCIIDVYGLDFIISHPCIQLILFGVSQLDSLISFFCVMSMGWTNLHHIYGFTSNYLTSMGMTDCGCMLSILYLWKDSTHLFVVYGFDSPIS
jgi:hypothetical protein